MRFVLAAAGKAIDRQKRYTTGTRGGQSGAFVPGVVHWAAAVEEEAARGIGLDRASHLTYKSLRNRILRCEAIFLS